MGQSVAQPRVLLADDEVLVRDLVQESLQEAGYEVVVAASAPEAFVALEADGDFVAVVTDINFGAPPRGWDVAVRAREGRPNIVIVYITGDSGHEWSAQGVPHSTIITKPFAPSQIAVAVASLLNKTDGASAP